MTESEMVLDHAERQVSVASTDAAALATQRRWFRWRIVNNARCIARLPGITRADAHQLALALRLLRFTEHVAAAVRWQVAVNTAVTSALTEQRWISRETLDTLTTQRPDREIGERVAAAGLELALSEHQRDALAFLDVDLEQHIESVNERVMRSELDTRRAFFDTIEQSPLTTEQARAVICFDDRVQVLAAAGSGKTSIMVARAAYAIERGFVPADRILLLAFNKNAAGELQDRLTDRLAAAGITSTGLRASTFHSFGLDVIGRATGKKPRLARWLDQGEDVHMVVRIVDDLRERSTGFRRRWDLYRMLFAHAPTDLTVDEPDDYDRTSRQNGYRTFQGDVVKSHGERLIANFLYLNGVAYEYERAYDVDVADAQHSQYRPDFYYPDIAVWHEHWAVDQDGNPPEAFEGYRDDMAWKRSLHAQHQTTLVESTWGDVMYGDGLKDLEAELTRLGLTFEWNPDRPINNNWAKPTKDEDLARFVRTFMTHVKSNSWTRETLTQRLTSQLKHLNGFRTRLFLDVYWGIHDEWEKRLAADDAVDFEDMLVQAAEHLEGGRADLGYDLVMVDELQDASRARARLVRALLQRPGRYLLAVGDDWQSINRFAGADLSVMTDFATWFGPGPQLSLTTTFRCTQTICDVASSFVAKNPGQFKKAMRSAHEDPGAPVSVIATDTPTKAIAEHLRTLSARISDGTITPGRAGVISVDVLGRYGFERDALPSRVPPNLKVTFRTVHGSKGLEADYIVVPSMGVGTYGFPSTIADDPVLAVATPTAETFAHAEERRLLYVALTRARRGVTIVVPAHRMSPFVVELLDDPNVIMSGDATAPVEACSSCGKGVMMERRGRFGAFLSCSTFPACAHKRNLTTRTHRPESRKHEAGVQAQQSRG